MSNDRHEPDKRKSTGAGADAAANDQQHASTREREPDESREQGHQGTASGSRRDRPKDDPSRAPESGTP